MKLLLSFNLIFAGLLLQAQNGITWQNVVPVAQSHFGNNHPRITCNENGEAYMVWGRTSDQSIQFAYWNGSSFSTPIKLNFSNVATASWMGPDIASRNDTIYVVIKSVPEDDPDSHMYLLSSFDGGRNFKQPVRIDDIGTDISRFPTIAIDQFGNPVVAYMRFDSIFKESRWVVTRSEDFGKTFLPSVLASGWGKSTEVCDCCPGSIICEGSTCAVFYRDNNKNMRDTWVSLSKDNAESFTTGFNVDNNNWNLSNCPASGPDGVLLEDNIFSVFMNGAKAPTKNYFSKSSLSTEKFIEIMNLGANVQNLRIQNFPRIAGNGKALAIIGTQSVNANKVEIPIWFTNNYENGLSSNYQIVDELNISNCDIAMNKNSIFVVWQDDNTRTINFRIGSYSPISNNSNAQKSATTVINKQNSWLINSENISSIKLMDGNGKILESKNFSTTNSIEIQHKDYPQSIYFLQIKDLDKWNTLKLIK